MKPSKDVEHKKPEKDVITYKKKIKKLKIIIDALIQQNENYKLRISELEKPKKKQEVIIEKEKIDVVEEKEVVKSVFADQNTINQIISLSIQRDEKVDAFKNNCSFDDFIVYCSKLDFDLFVDVSRIRTNQSIKTYVEINRVGLVNHFFSNLNSMRLSASFSTLIVLCKYLETSSKISLIYNIIQNTANPHFIVILCCAILNDHTFQFNILESTTEKILNFQFSIDKNVFSESAEIQRIYNLIERKFGLKSERIDLAVLAEDLINQMEFDTFTFSIKNVLHLLSLTLIANFLDWDWTYNKLISDFLFPMFDENRDRKYLYLIGCMSTLGLTLVGKHKSVVDCFEKIGIIMKDADLDNSLIAWYFYKRVFYIEANEWLVKNHEAYTKINEKLMFNEPDCY